MVSQRTFHIYALIRLQLTDRFKIQDFFCPAAYQRERKDGILSVLVYSPIIIKL